MALPWSPEAEQAISRVPFFVRSRVRRRVETEARQAGAHQVRLEHVHLCRQKFLHHMDAQVKGWQLEACFGFQDCPNRALETQGLVQDLEALLTGKNLREFLQAQIKKPLKLHHEFRVSLSACPNACSRPQIVDLGLIGALTPVLTPEPCSQCAQCVYTCREGAIRLTDTGPELDQESCLKCGDCPKVCPTGTLVAGAAGFRVLLGGKLGRHPQFGRELPGIYPLPEIVPLVDRCLTHFMTHYFPGQRFGDVLKQNEAAIPLPG